MVLWFVVWLEPSQGINSTVIQFYRGLIINHNVFYCSFNVLNHRDQWTVPEQSVKALQYVHYPLKTSDLETPLNSKKLGLKHNTEKYQENILHSLT